MSYFDQRPQEGSDEKAVIKRAYHMIGTFLIVYGMLSSGDLGLMLWSAAVNFKTSFGSLESAFGTVFDIAVFYSMLAFVLNAGLLTFDRTREFTLPLPPFINRWLFDKHQKMRASFESSDEKEGGDHERK
jgi:hypothetical protein